MLAGASGMRANSSALAAISDNIANVNTVGYKRLRNDFTALLTSQNQLTTHNAGGVLARHSAMMSEQGSPQASSVSTHLAISGSGFFVVRGNSDAALASEPYYYTRAGQFTPDAEGYLRNSAGYYLQGWTVAADGTVQANPTDLSALSPVRVSGIAGDAQATANVTMAANLQASQEVSTAAATYDATDSTLNMASGAVTPDFQIPVQIYDSQGGLHTLTFSFLKSGPNEWQAEVHLPASDVVDGGAFVDGQLATGIVRFTPYGQLDTANTTLPLTFTILANGTGGGPEWGPDFGVAAQTITLDFGGSASRSGLTNFDSPSVLGTTSVDGTPFGALASVDVDENGFVTAVFNNGLARQIYQVPVATFSNVNGLVAESGGIYRLGPGTGPLAMRPAGLGGAGEIKSRALESSTVDLAEEFSQLIMTQRAYSASSKIITTADDMMAELINLKR
jgi:flagellar hook protein FlgE